MKSTRSPAEQTLIGLIVLVLLSSLATLGIRASLGAYSDAYRLTATFDRTGHNLDTDSDVKVRGVGVGKVSGIDLLPDGRTRVTMKINKGVQVPDTTVASIEPLSIFGPEFVNLDPGAHEAAGPYLAVGAEITQTRPPTEITDLITGVSPLLTAVDPDELQSVLDTLAAAVDGEGPTLRQTLDNAGPLVDLLHRQSANAGPFLQDLARLTKALADKGPEAQALIRNLNAILPVITANGDHIGDLLDNASKLSGDLSTFLDAHKTALDQTVSGLSTVVLPIYQQLAALPDFTGALNGFFATLGNDLLRLPGPNGHVIGVLEGVEPGKLCQVIVGLVCP